MFELYHTNNDQGSSKILLQSSKIDRSKLNNFDGRLLGATKPVQASRLLRKNHEKNYDLISDQNKVIGKITVGYDYL